MPISEIEIDSAIYQIKDRTAREDIQNIMDSLGNLAFKDSASGDFTPIGTVEAPTISIESISTPLIVVENAGTLPSWNAAVENEKLSFNWNRGKQVTTKTQNVITAIGNVIASEPVFRGELGKVVVE